MRELNFTEDELKEVTRGNYIASGNEASIYKYKKYIAIRLYDIGEGIYCPITGKVIGKPLCERLISNLHIYKNNIKLTSFPLGIVKVNNVVVGQIIKFYNNSITLTDFFKSSPSIDPIPYYLKVLDILEELALNNISYEDVHGGNFLIVGNKLKIIDFSDHRIKVNENYKGHFYNMFQNFNSMVNKLNFDILKQDEKFNQLMIPEEIKEDTTHIKEDFNYIRKEIKNLKRKENPNKIKR